MYGTVHFTCPCDHFFRVYAGSQKQRHLMDDNYRQSPRERDRDRGDRDRDKDRDRERKSHRSRTRSRSRSRDRRKRSRSHSPKKKKTSSWDQVYIDHHISYVPQPRIFIQVPTDGSVISAGMGILGMLPGIPVQAPAVAQVSGTG